MTSPRQRQVLAGLLLLAGGCACARWAAAAATDIIQAHRSFSRTEAHIRRGDALRFTNDDSFTHQIAIRSPSFTFESAEQPPGQAVTVPFPIAGTFEVQCDIHPRMHMGVTVD